MYQSHTSSVSQHYCENNKFSYQMKRAQFKNKFFSVFTMYIFQNEIFILSL